MGVYDLLGIGFDARPGVGMFAVNTHSDGLIERSNTSCVQRKMSRVKIILVAVMPALLLLVSVDSFGDSTTRCGCDHLRCLFSPDGSSKQGSPSLDNSFDQAVHRGGRRANLQPRTDSFSPLVTPAQTEIPRPGQNGSSPGLPGISLHLARSWQFLWRTALEPRAPSLVS